MTYQDGTHDPVSAAELAHDRAQEKRPFWTCQRCREELFEEDAAAQNWLVCKRLECDQVLCEDCVIVGCEESNCNEFAAVYCNWESVHNAGFCSPACMARALDAINWGHRRARLQQHCDTAQVDVDEAKARELAGNDYGTIAALSVGLVTLIARVREVCK